MTTIASAVVLVLLVVASLVVIANWWAVIENGRNRRSGIDRHISMVPAAAQIIVLIAALIENASGAIIPSLIVWIIALSDLSLWGLLYLPIFLVRRRLCSRKRSSPDGLP